MSFEETTKAEAGFAALWDKEIEPSLDTYRRAYNRRIGLFFVGIPISLIVAYLLFAPLASMLPSAETRVIGLLCVITGGLLLCGFGYPLMQVQGSFDAFMKQVVSDHFGDVLLADDSEEEAKEIAARMTQSDLISKGRLKFSNIYYGRYRDCALRLFNLDSETGYGRNERSDYYFCMDVSVPMAFDGEVLIRTDYGRAYNFMRTIMSDRKQVAFDHAEFEKKFEVYAEDEVLARRLISPAFCDNLLAIRALFPKRYGILSPRIVAGFYDGHFSLVVKDNSDIFALSPWQTGPNGVEKGIRKLIARMHIVPSVIDYLHGDR